MTLTLLLLISALAQPPAGPEPASDSARLVAVLPFRLPIVATDSREAPAELFQEEISQGYQYQKVLHQKLQSRKRNRRYRLQAPAETNRLLALHGITSRNIDQYTAEELGPLLGVDAVLSMRLQAISLRSGRAALGGLMNPYAFPEEAVREKYRCRVTLLNCRSGEPVASYQDSFRLGPLSGINWPMHRLMERTARRMAVR
ncbi:hypothetical protein [Tellurirhabdus rosea]|uniref:hypothetical protein n=1 Tax=Tellurirhabdus rosea TaxID=2674997 RepID=UPI00224FB063|nr:hypothetical protein [Tellurirhabdus rosea]